MENTKTDKHEYLNHPCLLDNFKQTYLTSLNVFLNDEKYDSKIATLPILKSSAITRYEKQIDKENQERIKKGLNKIPPKILSNNTKATNTGTNKPLTLRYIIMDHELIEITLSALEESNECNSKLTDPFNAYFLESNEKIRKKALDQIISNIIPKKEDTNNPKDKNKKSTTAANAIYHDEQDKAINSLLYQDLMLLESKYKMTDEEIKQRIAANNLYKAFQENCDSHSIITLDQKIDYFVHLKKNGILTNNNSNNSPVHKDKNKGNLVRKKSQISSNNPTESKTDNQSIKRGGNEIMRYASDLRFKYKIYEDSEQKHQLECFEKELDTKIRTFSLLKKNFESSSKFIDKIRMDLSCQEVTGEKVIIRECTLTSDGFYYLTMKKYFDFNMLRHLNLAKNPLGDIGGCYLFTLIESYGIKFDYLNVSYTKINKQSCEILVNILKDNKIKIYSLAIGGNALGDKLFSDLCIGISKNAYLTKLFVNDNELGKISSVILGTILKYDKKLKTLDVSKNLFGDENIGYMMKGLICNSSLEILMINDMYLTNKSLRVFETTLCINTTLKELFLERNKLNAKGWRVLSDILNKNKYIEYLSLVGNSFESEHFDMIAEQQRQVKIRVISKTDYFLQITAGNENLNFYEYLY